MTHGSLFSGIGGFDLAAEWMGWQNVFHCEWNTFGQRVLKYYWPDSISYNDITKTDFTIHRGRIDILTGGFPCQPYSTAGKRLGKEDDRHLWPEMLRAIREIQPRWVVGENVLGLVNWSGGLVFHEVQADLEAEGYEVQPFVLPAVSVNAPHRRDRVWFVAHANLRRGWWQQRIGKHDLRGGEDEESYNNIIEANKRLEQRDDAKPSSDTNGVRLEQRKNSGEMGVRQTKICGAGGEFADATQTDGPFPNAPDTKSQSSKWVQPKFGESCQQKKGQFRGDGGKLVGERDATDTSSRGMEGYGGSSKDKQLQTTEFEQNNSEKFRRMDWGIFPTQSPVCNGNDGISYGLDSITFSKWRQESIKAGGNAVVPQLVLQIFKTIAEYEKLTIQRPSV